MPDKIDLPDGGWAQFRTALTGADRKWWRLRIDEVKRTNGTAKPAYHGPDPDNPAVMKDVPAADGYLRTEDDIALVEEVTARLLESWSLPHQLPYTAATGDLLDLDVFNAIEDATLAQVRRLNGLIPKPPRTSGTSATTSGDGAPAPPPVPAEPPSGTA